MAQQVPSGPVLCELRDPSAGLHTLLFALFPSGVNQYPCNWVSPTQLGVFYHSPPSGPLGDCLG